MKKIKYFLCLTALSVFTVSCSDAYDIVQKGELSDEVTFQSINDIDQFLTGIYAGVNTQSQIFLSSVLTDELGIGASNGGNDRNLHRFQLNVNVGYVFTSWYGPHSTVNRVNRLIQAASLVTPQTAEEQTRYNSILAEARVLRALAYLHISTFFSTDMTDPNALNGYAFTNVPSVADIQPRSTNAEVYSIIESDLAFADANLVDRTVDQVASPYKYVSNNMVKALKARYYLYRGNHTLARQFADELIQSSGLVLTPAGQYIPSNFYTPATASPYRRMWNDTDQGEIIFALDRPIGGNWSNLASMFYFNVTNLTGSIIFDMGYNLFNLYGGFAGNGDIRRFAFVDPTLVNVPNTPAPAGCSDDPICLYQYPIDKYPGKGNQPLRNDVKVFRLSEMYFIAAECAIVQGQLNEAAAYIKAVRDARSFVGPRPLPVYNNAQQAWTDVLLERRLELCYEGHRYIDLKRIGNLAGVQMDRHPFDFDGTDPPLTLPNNDFRFTLPIPQNEVDANPTVVQNPGH